MRHLVIPDIQAKPGVPLKHVAWAGNYIRAKRPETIVILGDLFDYPSLSTYDSASKKADKGVNVKEDYLAGKTALDMLMKPWQGIRAYKPKLVFIGGNHEDRLTRHLAEYPFLRGSLDAPLDYVASRGWKYIAFGNYTTLDGVRYSHLHARTSKGGATATSLRYGAPSAAAQVKNNMCSCTAGHKPGLDISPPIIIDGRVYRGLICGSFYQHEEVYRGMVGNEHWRGILQKNRVKNGDYDLTEISLDYLREKYG